ncbi:MAG TPA: LptF/LptG family permease [Phycisphaerae bacterium]|nr:LptF/LptG family permease [Phycisphaerae bacterium]
MKILDRYILRAFFINYLIGIGVLIGMYIILDLFVNLDEFTNLQSQTAVQTAARILDFYGHNLFLYFAQLAGVITLVAGCFTLGRLHRTNELTAILASGTSLYRVAAPILIAAFAMNALWFVDQEFIIPNIAEKLARKHGDTEGKVSFAVWFMPDTAQHNSLVSATAFNPRAREMRNVVIVKRDAQNRMIGAIRADQAKWDEERQVWHLRNGYEIALASPSEETVDIEALGGTPLHEYASGLTPRELAIQQSAQWTNFLSLIDIEKLQKYYAQAGNNEFIKVKHTRLTTVIMNMALLCLGIPFFLNRERPSVIVLGGKCLLLCGICYVFTFMANSIDLSGLGVSPALTPWLPVLIFTPVAVLMLDGIKT